MTSGSQIVLSMKPPSVFERPRAQSRECVSGAGGGFVGGAARGGAATVGRRGVVVVKLRSGGREGDAGAAGSIPLWNGGEGRSSPPGSCPGPRWL